MEVPEALFLLMVAISVCLALPENLEKSGRPSFAGSTGGTWESYVGQRIPPGTPWPAKAADSTTPKSNFENAKPSVDASIPTSDTVNKTIDKTETELPTASSTTTQTTDTSSSSGVSNASTSVVSQPVPDPYLVLGYKPNRPSYAGATGGTWGNYVGQNVPDKEGAGAPGNSSKLDQEPVQKVTETEYSGTTSRYSTTSTSTVLGQQPQRPSFAGASSGTWENLVGQIIPSSEPVQNSSGDSLVFPSTSDDDKSNLTFTEQNRPSFAGTSGGVLENYSTTTTAPATGNGPNDIRLPFLYIGLDRDAVKDAVKKSVPVKPPTNYKPLVLALNLNNLQLQTKTETDIKATEQFLSGEKCGGGAAVPQQNVVAKDPVVSLFVDVEGLVEVIREAYGEIGQSQRN